MLNYIFKKLMVKQKLRQNISLNNHSGQNKQAQTNHLQNNTSQKRSETNLSAELKLNLRTMRNILANSTDVIFREFSFGVDKKIDACLIFLEGMTDTKVINESVMRPLMYDSHLFSTEELWATRDIKIIQNSMISVGEVKQASTIEAVVDGCLFGDTVFLMDGAPKALVVSSKGWESRGVSEPKTEVVVRGPREGFTETLRANTSLLRRKLHNPNLKMEMMHLGQRSKTEVCIVYIRDLANPQLVEEVKRRLNQINIDAVLESGYIEAFIEDAPFSPFSTVGNSEKPDVVAAKILEGRVAILVDGTPVALTVPLLFIEGFQSAEDYYSRPYYASLIRTLRFIAFFLSISLPATYVALTTFHQELLPTPLLITIASGKEGTPFPGVVEALLMGLIFEILREAGVRLPRPVGSAVSIVGALVIGQAAVQAGIVGAPMIIVVSLTAISSFVVPSQTDVAVVLRLLLTIIASALGALGMLLVFLWIGIHLASLRSFGTPFVSPLAPLKAQGLKDVFIRAPLWAMSTRPSSIRPGDAQRQEYGLLPKPPVKNSEE